MPHQQEGTTSPYAARGIRLGHSFDYRSDRSQFPGLEKCLLARSGIRPTRGWLGSWLGWPFSCCRSVDVARGEGGKRKEKEGRKEGAKVTLYPISSRRPTDPPPFCSSGRVCSAVFSFLVRGYNCRVKTLRRESRQSCCFTTALLNTYYI